MDSIERDDDRFDLFLYDSLNDNSSDEDERFYDCLNDTNLIQTIANERQLIKQLTDRYSSLDSLDNYDHRLFENSKMFSMNTSTIRTNLKAIKRKRACCDCRASFV